jgi:hypothetical protein
MLNSPLFISSNNLNSLNENCARVNASNLNDR